MAGKKKEPVYESKAKVVRIAYEAGVTVEYKGKYYKENYREERVFEGEEIDIDIERQLLVDAVHDVVDKAVMEALEVQKARDSFLPQSIKNPPRLYSP